MLTIKFPRSKSYAIFSQGIRFLDYAVDKYTDSGKPREDQRTTRQASRDFALSYLPTKKNERANGFSFWQPARAVQVSKMSPKRVMRSASTVMIDYLKGRQSVAPFQVLEKHDSLELPPLKAASVSPRATTFA